MTDAFQDVLDDTDDTGVTDDDDGDDSAAVVDAPDSDDTHDSNDTTTVGVQSSTVTDTFADDVRTTVPESDDTLSDKRYGDSDTGEAADDVDPRGLFRQPTLNELRYYSREGPYGPALTGKPIEDAFKHGFDVEGDNTSGTIQSFLEDAVDTYIEAEKKARRDGLCVITHQISDSADSAATPLTFDDGTFDGFTLYTVDALTDELAATTVAKHTDFDHDQIYVSEGTEHGGVAIVDDIESPDDGEVLGYGIEPRQDSESVQDVHFLHASRCHHIVWQSHVDGPLGNTVTGKHVGESVFTPVLQPLKAAQMGYWSMMRILHRYSAPLHAVEPPETWGQDDWDDAEEKLGNISMASDTMLPPGAELSVAGGVSEFDPVPLYDVLAEAICAGSEFTKSVLQGVQTGTVSGSETDVKGYFNEVHKLRTRRIDTKFHEMVQKVAYYDQSTIPRVAGITDFEIDWGPLFKPTDVEQAEGAVSLITAATNGIKNYVLTPDEARSLIAEEWATFDIDIDLEDLSEDDWDSLDRINIRETGRGPQDDEPGVRENPRQHNGGGQPEGQTRNSAQPMRDSTPRNDVTTAGADGAATEDSPSRDTLSTEELDYIAEQVAQSLGEDTDD